MHIVHITEAVGGGVLAWLKDVCPELKRRGWKVSLVYALGRAQDLSGEAALPEGIELVPLDIARTASPLTVWSNAKDLAAYFTRVEPDVIHLHSSIAGGTGRLAARLAKYQDRILYSPHGLAFLRRDVPWPVRQGFWLAEWLGARLGGQGVACSRGEFDAMTSLFSAEKLHLIENAVNVSTIPITSRIAHERPVVGSSGRMVAQKAPAAFAELARQLSGQVADFVWIGGGGQEQTDMLQQVGVEVAGWLPRAAAVERVCGLDIYVSTALWEGMPLSLIEAQLAGIPAVVTDVVGNRDVVVHGRTGFIAKTPQELVAYVRQLSGDQQLRTTLGNNARELALQRFDMGRMVDNLESLYRQVTGK